jgi:hypothetical protein
MLPISVIYMVAVQEWVPIPAGFAPDVPKSLREAGLWAVTACVLHTLAAAVACFLTIGNIRRRRAEGRHLVPNNQFSWAFVVSGVASILPACVIALYATLDNRGFDTIAWVALPFTTAFFSIGYVWASVGDRLATIVSHPANQAASMGLVAFILSIILIPTDGFAWPIISWVFAAYATVIASAIGLTLGEVFKRSLAANVNRLFASDEGASRTKLLFLPSEQVTSPPPI